MRFGLSNAPAIDQSVTEDVLKDALGKDCVSPSGSFSLVAVSIACLWIMHCQQSIV